ncbi:hypothetical protein Mgra_00007206 [Meloidogyne graminicola]|uniref:Uncharacterized protein n=1 Tax=Meloidogyne graminicola TaxID=189291 RepID=A0A8S9ZJ24_9BILA|nr:hypothetical protein Mgra_00007206 [Meloidogyne graminicola]
MKINKSIYLICLIYLIQIIIEIILLFKTFSSFSTTTTTTLFLFYGIKQKQTKYFKPFLYIGIIWNFILLLLFIFCIIELIVAGKHFCAQIELTLNNLFNEKKENLFSESPNIF